MKRRIQLALWAYVAVVGGAGFFLVATYCILTPGSSDSGFSAPGSPIDPVQARLSQLWFLWGLIGSAVAGVAAWLIAELEDD